MTLLEAMACGKPIVSTYANFTKGLLENKKNALLVTPKSSVELAEATITLLSSEELCKSLGEAARKTILEKMDRESNTNKVEEVYKYAIEKFKRNKDVKKD
jgi:glycosyltransferase involved in cell wall biosynthesis